jgi:TATA-binding protein-associated factor Taf7
MARGWESKSVADQIEEGKSRQATAANAETSPEERLLKDRLAALQLSKSRLLQQLERATRPNHRNVLLNGLKAVEKELEEVEASLKVAH